MQERKFVMVGAVKCFDTCSDKDLVANRNQGAEFRSADGSIVVYKAFDHDRRLWTASIVLDDVVDSEIAYTAEAAAQKLTGKLSAQRESLNEVLGTLVKP